MKTTRSSKTKPVQFSLTDFSSINESQTKHSKTNQEDDNQDDKETQNTHNIYRVSKYLVKQGENSRSNNNAKNY